MCVLRLRWLFPILVYNVCVKTALAVTHPCYYLRHTDAHITYLR